MRLRIIAMVAILAFAAPAAAQIANVTPVPRVGVTDPIQRTTVGARRENEVRARLDRASADIRNAQMELARLRFLMSSWDIESNDRIGTYEVGDVMHTISENETLASDLQHRIDELRSGLRSPS